MNVIDIVFSVLAIIVLLVGIGAAARGGDLRALVASVVAAGMCMWAPSLIQSGGEPTWEVESSDPIVAMANNSEVSGHGGMFSVRIEEKNVIRYNVKNEDGSYSLEEIPADGVRVIEDANKDNARIDFETCNQRMFPDRDSALLDRGCGERITLHVPEGTVAREHSLDPAR